MVFTEPSNLNYHHCEVAVTEALQDQLSPQMAEHLMDQALRRSFEALPGQRVALRLGILEGLKAMDDYLSGLPAPDSVPTITFANPREATATLPAGLDAFQYEAHRANYVQLEINEAPYPVAWKALPSGQSSPVLAQVDEAMSFPPGVVFKQNDNVIPTQPAAQRHQRQVNLIGQGDEQEGSVAVYANDSEEAERVGQLNTVSYDVLPRKLVLVPLDGEYDHWELWPMLERVARIYQQAAVHLEVAIAEPVMMEGWERDHVLDDVTTGLLSNYTKEMRQVIRAFRRQQETDPETAYIFLDYQSKSGKRGYMPKKRQYGFVFDEPHRNYWELSTTIAHELGHGLFRLEHSFDTYPSLTQGSSRNLMDYGGGIKLRKYQWDLIHNPERMLGWFQDDEDAAMLGQTAFETLEAMSEEERKAYYLAVLESQVAPEHQQGPCWQRAKNKTFDLLASDQWYLSLYGSLLEFMLCHTEEEHCAWMGNEFTSGFTNALLQELDMIALVELYELVKEMEKERQGCLQDNLSFATMGSFNSSEEVFNELMRCTFGLDIKRADIELATTEIGKFVEQVWTDPYEQGQATEMLLSMFVPTSKLSKLRKANLLSKVRTSGKFSKAEHVFKGLHELESRNVDGLKKILNRGTGVVGKLGKSSFSSVSGFIDEISDIVKFEGISLDDFHYMMQKSTNALTESEKAIMSRIRSAMPKPSSTTLMQKVIPKSDIEKYLSGTYTEVGGYVTRASDAKHLESFDDIYHGLRLDYTGTTFFIEDGSCGVIRFVSPKSSSAVIPSGGEYAKYDYPFTAHGFTSGKNGRLGAPEWHFENRVEIDEGAEIWEVMSDSEEILRAKLADIGGEIKFVKQ